MEINVADYFTEDQISRIVEEELRVSVRQRLREEENVVVVNAIYKAVGKHVDAAIEEHPELQDLIVEKTKGVITKLSNYTVFYKPDAWGKRRGEEKSVGQQILEEEVTKRRERIGGRVDRVIREMNYDGMKDLVLSAMNEMFWDYEEQREAN